MNIIHIIFSLEVGGTELLLAEIANEQSKSYNVTIIVINNRISSIVQSKFNNRVRILSLNRKAGSKSHLFPIVKLWRLLFILKPKFIHCHNHNIIRLLPFWRKRIGLTVHDVNYPTRYIKKYKKVFSISKSVQNQLLETSNITSILVYNGIYIKDYKKKENYEYYSSQTFKVVQVGRLIQSKKGQDVALKAIKILKELFPSLKIELEFWGDGNSKKALIALSSRLGVNDVVFFRGEVDRNYIKQHLCKFQVLIQPSRFEGFGITIIEGLAAGLPVIASNIDGPKEILEEFPSGFLFDAGKEAELAKCLKNVIDMYNQRKIQSLCSLSFNLLEEHYSVKQTALKYLLNY